MSLPFCPYFLPLPGLPIHIGFFVVLKSTSVLSSWRLYTYSLILGGIFSHHISTHLNVSPDSYPAEPILSSCLHFLDSTDYLKVYSLLLIYVFSDVKVNTTQLQRYLSTLFTEVCQNTPSKWRTSCFTVILYH